jgi:mRNA interferase MazF
VVVQGDSFNQRCISTAVCVSLTSNLLRAESPGNVLLPARLTGLPKDSAANVSQIASLDRRLLPEKVGKLQRAELQLVLAGIDALLGR